MRAGDNPQRARTAPMELWALLRVEGLCRLWLLNVPSPVQIRAAHFD